MKNQFRLRLKEGTIYRFKAAFKTYQRSFPDGTMNDFVKDMIVKFKRLYDTNSKQELKKKKYEILLDDECVEGLREVSDLIYNVPRNLLLLPLIGTDQSQDGVICALLNIESMVDGKGNPKTSL